MPYPARQLFFLISTICLLSLSTFPATASDWEWKTEGRVIAVSDIHGAFDDFVALLKDVQLINDDGHWTAGVDHLVIVGDVLDRGAASRDAIDLIMRLESEAEKAGGMVHLVLGNHEVMNLVGDLRYVAVGEYASYANVEDPEDRSAGLQKFKTLPQNTALDEATTLESFNKTHPPGFFGHSKVYSEKGTLGKWLLTRPVIIKVNDSVFVHGGLSPSMMDKSPGDINDLHRKVLRDYVSSREYFVNKGVLGSATNFFDQPQLIKKTLEAMAESGGLSQEDQKMAKRLFDSYRSDVFADDSPTWYRGNVGCSEAIEEGRLGLQLKKLGAKHLVVGHTPTPSRTIESRFNGMLIQVDAGILNSHYHGQPAALIIKDEKTTAYYLNSPTDNSITMQVRRVGPRPGNLTDLELEEVLKIGAINNSVNLSDNIIQLSIEYEDQLIDALFRSAGSKAKKVFLPGVAAYRLDRHLGLEMVPVAVKRTVEGMQGEVTLNLGNLIDEDQRIARQMGSSAWCSLKDQFNMMYMFDILVHNKGRERNAMRYLSNDMKLILTGNGNTLSSKRGAPAYLKSVVVSISDPLKLQLQKMNPELLEELLGDVLDEKHRKAILSRRDHLLERSK